MQCEEIQLDLTAYLDDRLPAQRQAAIEKHLSGCQACSEEAAAMRDIGNMLSRGLKEWVDQGVCPSEVMDQIERSLRSGSRKAWWQRWPTYAGVATAAAAVFLVLLASRYDVSHQMASLPLVGTLAAQIFYPNADVRVADIPDATEIQAADEHDGLVFALHSLITGADAVRVQYSLRGSTLDTGDNVNRYRATLSTAAGTLKLRSLNIKRADGEVLLSAMYEPVLPGQPLKLSVTNVPLQYSMSELTWTVTVKP